MIDARLRRLCDKKPSGKCSVPQNIHDQWKLGGKARDELRMLLEKYDFDKASPCSFKGGVTTSSIVNQHSSSNVRDVIAFFG